MNFVWLVENVHEKLMIEIISGGYEIRNMRLL